ncbi:MAG: phasin family protein [Xenococcaceae cyanobacterium]
MAGLENLVKKAFYMGVGIASYANEKAGETIGELRIQGQKLAEEMVKRGEMTTDEARKFVDDLVKQAQQDAVKPSDEDDSQPKEPRRIEILSDDEETKQPETKQPQTKQSEKPEHLDDLRQQVQSLQEELRRLKRE